MGKINTEIKLLNEQQYNQMGERKLKYTSTEYGNHIRLQQTVNRATIREK